MEAKRGSITCPRLQVAELGFELGSVLPQQAIMLTALTTVLHCCQFLLMKILLRGVYLSHCQSWSFIHMHTHSVCHL